jgi:hypothetical protein
LLWTPRVTSSSRTLQPALGRCASCFPPRARRAPSLGLLAPWMAPQAPRGQSTRPAASRQRAVGPPFTWPLTCGCGTSPARYVPGGSIAPRHLALPRGLPRPPRASAGRTALPAAGRPRLAPTARTTPPLAPPPRPPALPAPWEVTAPRAPPSTCPAPRGATAHLWACPLPFVPPTAPPQRATAAPRGPPRHQACPAPWAMRAQAETALRP